MKLIEFLIKAKVNTYADGIKYKVPSTQNNSIDYHYEEDNFVYHDTYYGSKEFYCEEKVYLDNKLIWHMEYKGGVIHDKNINIYDKVLKPALKKIDDEFSLRGPKEFSVDDYKYTFKANGSIENFKEIEKIYKDDKLVYELICYGGKIK